MSFLNARNVLFVSFCLPAAVVFAGQDSRGVPNFHQIDSHVYRGGQPTPDGFRNLAGLGIKTVIDLRGPEHSEADEKQIVEADGMRYVSIPMKGMKTPSDAQISGALALMNDDAAGPVFVHCQRVADRTGAVIACYRIQHDHWDSDKAVNEARALGMSWYQVALQRYVGQFGKGSGQPIPALITPALITPPALSR